MNKQTYQQVEEIIIDDLRKLKRLGVSNLNKINLKEYQGGYQKYFFYRKNKHPEKYERLWFNTNGHEPFCGDLSSIIMDFKICGILDCENNIIPTSRYLNEK